MDLTIVAVDVVLAVCSPRDHGGRGAFDFTQASVCLIAAGAVMMTPRVG